MIWIFSGLTLIPVVLDLVLTKMSLDDVSLIGNRSQFLDGKRRLRRRDERRVARCEVHREDLGKNR